MPSLSYWLSFIKILWVVFKYEPFQKIANRRKHGHQETNLDPNETITDWVEPGATINILAKFDQNSSPAF